VPVERAASRMAPAIGDAAPWMESIAMRVGRGFRRFARLG
jgi:hypothetical protein